MKKDIFPDETLQRMHSILCSGSNHGLYPWALGVLEATLMMPRRGINWPSDQKKYNEGYDLRTAEIRKAYADENNTRAADHPTIIMTQDEQELSFENCDDEQEEKATYGERQQWEKMWDGDNMRK